MATSLRNTSFRYIILAIFAAMLLLLLVLAAPLQASSVFYAAPLAVGSGDCGSWGNACTLGTALLLASGSPGSEIWVLEGVHKPTTVITDRTATFFVPDGVAIYGGFDGGESAREERDWETNPTVLSGDIDNNDLTDPSGVVTSTANITGTNSYHVLLGGAASYSAVLDGFTVTGGYADGPYSGWCDYACGGGMYNNNGQVTVDNVTFSGNYATNWGGGMYNIYASPILSGTSFINNQAEQGGGLALRRSASALTNITFSGNGANEGGGVYYNESSLSTWSGSHTVSSVTFLDNTAISRGGGMYNAFGNLTLEDVTFSGNDAGGTGGGGFYTNGNTTFTTTLTNVMFAGNSAIGGGAYGGGMRDDFGQGFYTDVIFDGNLAEGCGGGLYTSNASSTLSGSTFIDNESTCGGGMAMHDGTTSLSGTLFSGNSTSASGNYDGGGMHVNYGLASFSDVSFEDNTATQNGGGLYTGGTTAKFTNVLFIENSAGSGSGGGMANASSVISLTNTLLISNTAISGGGLYNLSGSPTLTSVTFIDNTAIAGDGGGMFGAYGPAALSDVLFERNTATQNGGGLFNLNATSTLTATTFISNSADYGGGMANKSSFTSLTNTLFMSNTATSGGGIVNFAGGSNSLSAVTFAGNQASSSGGGMVNEVTAVLVNVTFTNNEARDGGGLYNFGNSGIATLLEVSFSGNNAEYGGGLYSLLSSPTLTNVSFIGNDAIPGDGGGMYLESGQAIFSDATFDGNLATRHGGGLYTGGTTAALTNVDFVDNSADDGYGGGMANFGSVTSLTNTLFMSNTAISGGGVFNAFDGSQSLSAVSFTGNQASGAGGGMYNEVSALLENVSFTNNEGYDGGGLYNYGSPGIATLLDVTFSGNNATYGGGMFDVYGPAAMSDVLFQGNSAIAFGGGLYENHASPSLTNVRFIENLSQSGGGLAAYDSSPTLTNVLFLNNNASILFPPQEDSGRGGGFYNFGSSPTLTNATFYGNQAEVGGGAMYSRSSSNPVINNSILWGDTPEEFNSDATGTLTINYSDVAGGCPAGGTCSHLLDSDPFFTDAAAGDLRLLPDSPSIDAGDNSVISATTDLSGGPRFIDIPSSPDTGLGSPPLVDMGAYEANFVDAALIKTVTPVTYLPGTAITFTLSFSNGGSITATNVTVSDAVPWYLTSPAWSWSGAAVSDTGQLPPFIWSVQDLAPGQTALITLAGMLTMPLAAGTYSNTALIMVNEDAAAGNNGATVTFQVPDVAPFFSTTPVTVATQDVPYSYGIGAEDLNGDSLTITAPAKPDWLVLTDFGGGMASLSGTPDNGDVGDHHVLLVVTDGGGLTTEQPFTITVANVNTAPFFTSAPLITATQDVLYSYGIATYDPDLIYGDSLTITAPAKPAWLILTDNNDGTATLSGTPDNGDVGDHDVLLRVTDGGGLMAEQPFTITVANVNDAPIFTSTPGITATQDMLYSYSITAVDSDLIWGDALTITAPTKPDWLTLSDNGDGTAALSGTPDNGSMGDHEVLLVVTDGGGLTDGQSFTINVANVNDPPVFTSSPVITAVQDLLYNYSIISDDPDLIWGDTLTITPQTKPDWLTLTDNGDGTATLSGTPDNGDVGDHSVLLYVTDSGGLMAEQPFTITVANVNDAPIFTSVPLTAIAQNIAYNYAITTGDPDLIWGDALTITAPAKPVWLTLSDNGDGTATLYGIPRDAEIGAHAVMLRVTDSDGLSDTQSFTITVRGRFFLPLLIR